MFLSVHQETLLFRSTPRARKGFLLLICYFVQSYCKCKGAMKNWILIMTLPTIVICNSGSNHGCGGEIVKIQEHIVYRYTRRINSLYEWDEDMRTTCLYYRSYHGIEDRPKYFKIIIKDLLVSEQPIQIKARRDRRNYWEIQNYFSNIYMSSTIVTVHVQKYEEIKILIPRTIPFDMKLEEAYDMKRANSNEFYRLPGYCSGITDDIWAVDCVYLEHGTQCLFQCPPEFVPTYIDRQNYPLFIAQCHRDTIESTFPIKPDFVENWKPSRPSCVRKAEVAESCHRPDLYCRYTIPALNVWFVASHGRSERNFRAYYPPFPVTDDIGVYEIRYHMQSDGTLHRLIHEPLRYPYGLEGRRLHPPRNTCRRSGFCHEDCQSLSSESLQLRCSICQFGSQCRYRKGFAGK